MSDRRLTFGCITLRDVVLLLISAVLGVKMSIKENVRPIWSMIFSLSTADSAQIFAVCMKSRKTPHAQMRWKVCPPCYTSLFRVLAGALSFNFQSRDSSALTV